MADRINCYLNDVKLMEADERERELTDMKEIYELFKYRLEDVDSVSMCKMPKENIDRGTITSADHDMMLRELWEECPLSALDLRIESRKEACDFEFVFEDGIEFIKEAIIGGEEEMIIDMVRETSAAKSSVHRKLPEERKTLPIYRYRDEFLKVINDHVVLIIYRETGSGETTQIPQYLHEAGYTKKGKIGCTQPRRIAAMSVAACVSKEMGVKLGHRVGSSNCSLQRMFSSI